MSEGDETTLFERIGEKLLDQVETFRARAVLPRDNGVKWSLSGERRFELLVKPKPACPWCKERVTVENIWLVDKNECKITKAWNLEGRVIRDYSKIHPHVYDNGNICMGNAANAVQALLEGMNPGSVLHDMNQYLTKWGHAEDDCSTRKAAKAAREEQERIRREAEETRQRLIEERRLKLETGEWDWYCQVILCVNGGAGGQNGVDWIRIDGLNPSTGMNGSYHLCAEHFPVYIVKCKDCLEWHDKRSYQVHKIINLPGEEWICDTCLDQCDTHYYCVGCGYLHVGEEPNVVINGESYCADCSDRVVTCFGCGEVTTNTSVGGNDEQYCDDCWNDLWAVCESCDATVRQSLMEDGLCDECRENDMDDYEIEF